MRCRTRTVRGSENWTATTRRRYTDYRVTPLANDRLTAAAADGRRRYLGDNGTNQGRDRDRTVR